MFLVFFFNDTATTEIYTLSLHDALPIYDDRRAAQHRLQAMLGLAQRLLGERPLAQFLLRRAVEAGGVHRSGEHTSELQSRQYPVWPLLLGKKTTTSRTYGAYYSYTSSST